jgi:hypothetical protein
MKRDPPLSERVAAVDRAPLQDRAALELALPPWLRRQRRLAARAFGE